MEKEVRSCTLRLEHHRLLSGRRNLGPEEPVCPLILHLKPRHRGLTPLTFTAFPFSLWSAPASATALAPQGPSAGRQPSLTRTTQTQSSLHSANICWVAEVRALLSCVHSTGGRGRFLPSCCRSTENNEQRDWGADGWMASESGVLSLTGVARNGRSGVQLCLQRNQWKLDTSSPTKTFLP